MRSQFVIFINGVLFGVWLVIFIFSLFDYSIPRYLIGISFAIALYSGINFIHNILNEEK